MQEKEYLELLIRSLKKKLLLLNKITVLNQEQRSILQDENADPDVIQDMLYAMEQAYPTKDIRYRHFEGNSHAHVKASSMGSSVTLILEEGEMILGVWQDLYLCEFDGPRQRTFYVKVMEG